MKQNKTNKQKQKEQSLKKQQNSVLFKENHVIS
jgi:hypothetical protein